MLGRGDIAGFSFALDFPLVRVRAVVEPGAGPRASYRFFDGWFKRADQLTADGVYNIVGVVCRTFGPLV
jgi:hypothetical protein